MKLLIETQYRENYGTAEEPDWKFKGGEDYIFEVDGFDFEDEMAEKKARMLVDAIADKIEYSGAMSEEYIVNVSFVEDDYMNWFEKSQLELDGEVTYPAKRFNYDEFVKSEELA